MSSEHKVFAKFIEEWQVKRFLQFPRGGTRASITHGITSCTSTKFRKNYFTLILKVFFLQCTRVFRQECEREVHGWPNAVFKKFTSEKLAWDFVKENCPNKKLTAGVSPMKVSNTSKGALTDSVKSAVDERLRRIEFQIQEFHTKILQEINTIRTEFLSQSTCSLPKRALMIDIGNAPTPPEEYLAKCAAECSIASASKKIKLDDEDRSSGSISSTFKVDSEGYVEVYTDGACTKNGRMGAKGGIGVWFADGHRLNISKPVDGRITNNSAEIEAATAAILAAKKEGVKKLKLYTDSNFLISAITSWIKRWKVNGWKTAEGEPVKNKEELILLENAKKGLEVVFVHVKGHAGNYANEQADALARAGAEKCPLSKMD